MLDDIILHEDIFRMVESKVNEVDGQIQQKILKGHEIRFYIAPSKVKPPTTTTTESSKPKSGEEIELEIEDDVASNVNSALLKPQKAKKKSS